MASTSAQTYQQPVISTGAPTASPSVRSGETRILYAKLFPIATITHNKTLFNALPYEVAEVTLVKHEMESVITLSAEV